MHSAEAECVVINARTCIYRLLANLFARELRREDVCDLQSGPTREIIDRLQKGAGCPRVIQNLGAAFKGALDLQQTVLDLAEAYAWLFHGVAGPHGASLYVSVYLSAQGVTHQQPEAELNTVMRDHGLTYSNYAHEPCDHLAVILEFVAWLAEQGETMGEGGRWVETQQQIIERYLLSWLPVFVDQCRHGDRQGFYATLAADTLVFIRSDHAQLTRS